MTDRWILREIDALRLKIRDEGSIKNKANYLALGIRADGHKEALGLWIEQAEGAKFWLKVFNALRNPNTQIQTRMIHLIRKSLTFASWKERKSLAAARKPIYQAANSSAAQAALDDFEKGD